MHAMVIQNLNPSYIFIQFGEASKRYDSLTAKIARILPHFTITSEFLAILVSRSKPEWSISSAVSGFCLTCSYDVGMADIPPFVSNTDDLSAWFRTHRDDMNGLYVQSHFAVHPFHKCGLYQESDPPALQPDYCTNKILSRYLNYSLLKPSSGRVVGEIYSHLIMDFGSIEKLFLRKSTTRYIWGNYGCSYNSFNFQVFTVSNYVNYAALLLPFDIFNWILTFAGGTFVNILVFKITASVASTNGYLFVWSFISALEQPVAAKKESSSIKLLMLCGTWLTSIYILGSLYKGDMVSVLTSRTTQQVPNTLKELISTNTTIFTTNHYDDYLVGPTPIARCTLHSLAIPQLMNAINSTYSMHHTLTRLQRSSKCIKIVSVYEMSENILKHGHLRTISGKEFIIPDQFAFLDPTFLLTALQATMPLFATYLPIHNGEIALYTELRPWIVSANFFGPAFISGLASLIESGIYGWWSNNFMEVALLIDIAGVKGGGNIGEEFAKVSFAREMRTKHGVMTAELDLCFFVRSGFIFTIEEAQVK
ncbi:hypothetical protein Fcan01_27420 [Folsomia candida]|uniref:Ionotropic glutamate receptor C-terminal domain-containing protein n=1 Tax=Folsomia candida TaxID=158441 RepID=A0A226CZ63_FOLCA|nr:hypothetical protein Fcan01_27420 [Folsomia candida]